MIHLQNCASRLALGPKILVAASTENGAVLDCAGFDYVMVSCFVQVAGGAVTSLALNFGDTTSPTETFKQFGVVSSSLSETIEGTTGTAPANAQQRVFLIDLKTRPRYMRLVLTGNGSLGGSVTAFATFMRLAESDYTNTAIADTGGEVIQG